MIAARGINLALQALLIIAAPWQVSARGHVSARDDPERTGYASFEWVDGKTVLQGFGHKTDDATRPMRFRSNNPFAQGSSHENMKRPCKRLFTSVEGQNVLAQFDRGTGKTKLIHFYDKPFVNTIEYDFQTDEILGLVNGTLLADIGSKQAHVRIRGPTGVDYMQSIVVSSYGELFGYSPSNTAIYELNKFTGEATSIGETGLENLVDMAYWFQEDLVFVTDRESLFVIDIINRELGEVGPIQGLPDGQKIESLVITPQGSLFGVTDEPEGATVWEIEKFTAKVATSRDPVSSSLTSAVSGGTLRCPLARLPTNAFGRDAPTPGPAPTAPSAPAPSVSTTESWETDIDLNNVQNISHHGAFDAAKDRWDGIITEGATDVRVTGGSLEPCDVPEFVDDVWICAAVQPIDNSSGTLGFAGPAGVRRDSGLPFAGLMVFDSADVDRKISEGEFTSIVLHEMAHVLGIGSLWDDAGLSDSSSPPCVYANESMASEEYRRLSGCKGKAVPIENDGQEATSCGHWDEECFIDELMTGYLSGNDQPLSRLTIAGLDDLGYTVDYDLADPYDSSRMSSSCLCEEGVGVTQPSLKEPISEEGYRAMLTAGKAHLARMSLLRETWEESSNGVEFVADKVVHVFYEDENGELYVALVTA